MNKIILSLLFAAPYFSRAQNIPVGFSTIFHDKDQYFVTSPLSAHYSNPGSVGVWNSFSASVYSRIGTQEDMFHSSNLIQLEGNHTFSNDNKIGIGLNANTSFFRFSSLSSYSGIGIPINYQFGSKEISFSFGIEPGMDAWASMNDVPGSAITLNPYAKVGGLFRHSHFYIGYSLDSRFGSDIQLGGIFDFEKAQSITTLRHTFTGSSFEDILSTDYIEFISSVKLLKNNISLGAGFRYVSLLNRKKQALLVLGYEFEKWKFSYNLQITDHEHFSGTQFGHQFGVLYSIPQIGLK